MIPVQYSQEGPYVIMLDQVTRLTRLDRAKYFDGSNAIFYGDYISTKIAGSRRQSDLIKPGSIERPSNNLFPFFRWDTKRLSPFTFENSDHFEPSNALSFDERAFRALGLRRNDSSERENGGRLLDDVLAKLFDSGVAEVQVFYGKGTKCYVGQAQLRPVVIRGLGRQLRHLLFLIWDSLCSS